MRDKTLASSWKLKPIVMMDEAFVQIRDNVIERLNDLWTPFVGGLDTSTLKRTSTLEELITAFAGPDMIDEFQWKPKDGTTGDVLVSALAPWSETGSWLAFASNGPDPEVWGTIVTRGHHVGTRFGSLRELGHQLARRQSVEPGLTLTAMLSEAVFDDLAARQVY